MTRIKIGVMVTDYIYIDMILGDLAVRRMVSGLFGNLYGVFFHYGVTAGQQ